MDFLLECIGFPPEQDQRALARLVLQQGEPVAWRGPGGLHMQLRLGGGLALRLDCDGDGDGEVVGQPLDVFPYFDEPARLRIGVEHLARIPDSRFDALLRGWVAPPAPGLDQAWDAPGAYRVSTRITDARRLPLRLAPGRVLAVSIAGFGLDLTYCGPNEGLRERAFLERPHGAHVEPLDEDECAPGGCNEVSARVRAVRHVLNPITGRPVDVLEVDAPERPLHLFVSPWQLRNQGFDAPRPGWRIEGAFLFTGRVAGGIAGPPARARRAFG